jgi:hypothetical protein
VIRMRQARRRPPASGRALVALAAAGLVLTGCGSSLGIHPGSAAVIGGRSISMSTIDSTASLYCKVFLSQQRSQPSQQQSGPVPMGILRSYAAVSLAQRALGEQLADAYGVQPASGYQRQVSQFRQVLASSPADQRDAAIAVAGADPYLQNVQVSIGQQLGECRRTRGPRARQGRHPGLAQGPRHLHRPGARDLRRRRHVHAPEGPDVVPAERPGLRRGQGRRAAGAPRRVHVRPVGCPGLRLSW